MFSHFFDNNDRNAAPDKVHTPLRGIQLDGGLMAEVFQNNANFLHKIDVDAALYWFRVKAGVPAPGQPYRGHFEDDIKGQTAAQLLMGAGNALRWAEDSGLRMLVDTVVEGIRSASEADGYLMAVPKEQFGTFEYPGYVRIWLTYGLYAAALGGHPDALEMLRRWQDWFNACDDLPIIKYLDLAYQGLVASPFVYNTPVGKQDDIDTTIQYYQENWRLGQFIQRQRDAIHIRRQHGYEPHAHGTELEALEGYLDLYRATGKHFYLRAVQSAWEMYRRDWQHPGGGIVMCEYQEAHPGCAWLSPPIPYNELCCTVFWIGLNQRLHRLFPAEEKYVSEIERSLYNVAFANQDGDNGIRYFAWIEGKKQPGGLVHCCCGAGTRLFGMLPEYLYSAGEDCLFVDIYSASTFAWQRAGGTVQVQTKTKMPYDGTIEITVECEQAGDFILYLRIPAWTKSEVEVLVDDKALTGQPGQYLPIALDWRGRHSIRFTLPFGWTQTLYQGAEQVRDDRVDPPVVYRRLALEYGPLLMAVAGAQETLEFAPNQVQRIHLDNRPEDFRDWLEALEQPLHFKICGHETYHLKPYFELRNGEPFSCYPLYR